jgi:hypothetical protein
MDVVSSTSHKRPRVDQEHAPARQFVRIPGGLSLCTYFAQLRANPLLFFFLVSADIMGLLERYVGCCTKGAVADLRRCYKQYSFGMPRPFSHLGMNCAGGLVFMTIDLRTNNFIFGLYADNKVVICSDRGLPIKEFASGQHSRPIACVVDSRGRFFVYEKDRRAVSVFSPDERIELEILYSSEGKQLMLSPDERILYIASSYALMAHSTETGAVVREYGIGIPYPICECALRSTGDILIRAIDRHGASLHVLRTDGSRHRVSMGGAKKTGRVPLICVDGADTIFVACRDSTTRDDKSTFKTISDSGEIVSCVEKGTRRTLAHNEIVTGFFIDREGRLVVVSEYTITVYASD